TSYPDSYSPGLLEALPRRRQASPAKYGEDIWNQYELSWLDDAGYPCVGVLECRLPCDSPALIESKSMKLYFNSLNQTRFASSALMLERVRRDLSACAGAEWRLALTYPLPLTGAADQQDQSRMTGRSIEASGDADLLTVGHQMWADADIIDDLTRAPSSAGPQWPPSDAERSVRL